MQEIFLMHEHGAGGKLPAVVCVTPWSSVKEQTSGLYAQKLCEQGFVALAFDHRHYGENEGQPRCYEYPAGKVPSIVFQWGLSTAETDRRWKSMQQLNLFVEPLDFDGTGELHSHNIIEGPTEIPSICCAAIILKGVTIQLGSSQTGQVSCLCSLLSWLSPAAL